MRLPKIYDWERVRGALKLLTNKERPQDRLHHAVLVQFLKHEFCADLEKPHALDSDDWVLRAREAKTADLQFFQRDTRFNQRLGRAVSALNPTLHKRVVQWAKHHLPAGPNPLAP